MRNKKFFFTLFLASFAGFSLKIVGTLFVADLLILMAFVFCLPTLFRVIESRSLRVLIIVSLVIPYFFLGLDIINGISTDAVLKGLARNVIFSASVVVSFWYASRFGVSRLLILITVCSLSYTLAVYLGFGDASLLNFGTFSAYLKFHNLLGAVIGVYWLFYFGFIVGLLAVIATALYLALLADFRSGAVMAVFPLFVVMATALARRYSGKALALILLCVAAAVIPFLLKFYMDDRYFEQEVIERREMSNQQRADMALFVWEEIKERPFLGYGSWSNSERYQSEDASGKVSVHSAVLQYLYEYGILGAIYILSWLFVSLWGIGKVMAFYAARKDVSYWAMFSFYFFWFGFTLNLCVGQILGYSRITSGLTAGLILYLAVTKAVAGQDLGSAMRRVGQPHINKSR